MERGHDGGTTLSPRRNVGAEAGVPEQRFAGASPAAKDLHTGKPSGVRSPVYLRRAVSDSAAISLAAGSAASLLDDEDDCLHAAPDMQLPPHAHGDTPRHRHVTASVFNGASKEVLDGAPLAECASPRTGASNAEAWANVLHVLLPALLILAGNLASAHAAHVLIAEHGVQNKAALTISTCIGQALYGLLTGATSGADSSQHAAPWRAHAACAALVSVALLLTSYAQIHTPALAFIVVKSARIVPTMAISAALRSRVYGVADWVTCAAVTAGLVVALAPPPSPTPEATTTSQAVGGDWLAALPILACMALLDGCQTNSMELLMKRYRATPAEYARFTMTLALALLIAVAAADADFLALVHRAWQEPRTGAWFLVHSGGCAASALSTAIIVQHEGSGTAGFVSALAKLAVIVQVAHAPASPGLRPLQMAGVGLVVTAITSLSMYKIFASPDVRTVVYDMRVRALSRGGGVQRRTKSMSSL